MFKLTFVIMWVAFAWGRKNYQQVELKTNPGIYYEKLDVVRIQRADWRVIVTIETEKLIQNHDIQDQIENITKLCYDQKKAHPCDGLVDLVYYEIELAELTRLRQELTDRMKDLSLKDTREYREPDTIRSKRLAPLGVIGTVSKSLFGLVTTDDVEQIHAQVDHLQDHQRQIIHLQKEQAHLITGTLEELHNETLKNKEKINQFEKYLKNWYMDHEGDVIRYAISLHAHSQSILLHLRQLIETHKRTLRIVTEA